MSRVRVVAISIALVLCVVVNVESLFELQCADNEEKMAEARASGLKGNFRIEIILNI